MISFASVRNVQFQIEAWAPKSRPAAEHADCWSPVQKAMLTRPWFALLYGLRYLQLVL